MASLGAVRKDRAEWARSRPVHLSMTLTDEGLVLGAGTVLAKAGFDQWGRFELALNGAEQRILALLAVAYGRPVSPSVLDNIRRASQQWSRGETCLALIHLAYIGLPKLPDQKEASFRLSLAEGALADGVTPGDLLKACCIDNVGLDLLKGGYDPSQPRAPKGTPAGGQWTTAEDHRSRPTPSSPAPNWSTLSLCSGCQTTPSLS